MRTYHHDAAPLAYASPDVNLLTLGLAALVLGGVLALGCHGLASAADVPILGAVVYVMGQTAVVALGIGVAALIAAAVVHRCQPASAKIRHKVRRALCHPRYGNPLRLRDGELLPAVNCKDIGGGVYELTIEARSCTVETITDAASAISTAVNGRFARYAVTQTDAGVAHDKVVFRLEDVLVDHSLTFHSAEEMQPVSPTRLRVQNGADIDLTTSGSMLVAGKTRSGKTTGIIALLLQVLLAGRDRHGSEVIVIDPKQAELSRLPHVVTLDENGEATEILAALRWFAGSIIKRQCTLPSWTCGTPRTSSPCTPGITPLAVFMAAPAISDELNFALCFSPWTFPVKSARHPAPGCLDFSGVSTHAGGHQKNGKSDIYGGPSVFMKRRPFRGRQNRTYAGIGIRAVLAVFRNRERGETVFF